MEHVERSIVVEAPVAVVYARWTRIDDYPQFMKALREVRPIGENRFLWRGERNGHEFESVAEVTLQIPERRLAWRSVSGAENSGVVSFESESDGATRISFKMKYAADAGWQEPASLERRLEDNLRNFKELIETSASQDLRPEE